MPTVARSRSIPAPPARVWDLVADPHNLPRWWPETVRVEDVHGEPGSRRSRFTQVFRTSKGTAVRADFRCKASRRGESIVWEQELEGTPFEGFLRDSELELRLAPADGGTDVTVEGRRRLRGLSRLGGPMMRRATGRTLARALEGIDRALCGPREAAG
jgi:uncharacterized protein YndB with AHSA1/START domain